ncbi:MAG: HD domain-containing protein [Parcubacteria group bacterium]|nr:HD domain-containing protein [Parcubacteria group bacterium]
MNLPEEIKEILKKLESVGFEAFVVGGCVRDLLLGKKPKDWDITTNAKPEEIQKIFPDSFYENKFGTVGAKIDSEDESLKVVEITTYRIESKYSDKRHPDKIEFASSLQEDLKRRDFTINALAMDKDGKITDLFDGQEDLKNKLIRAVGKAEERFDEDALRLLRAVRFAVELDFEIEGKTLEAIKEKAGLIEAIAEERVRDELLKIIQHTPENWIKKSERRSNEVTKEELKRGPARAFELMREAGLLKLILPEFEDGYEVGQNKHHVFSVWEHNLRAFTYAVKENFNFHVRLGALFHDIAKPHTKKGEGPDSTFYGHDVVGGKMVGKIMSRLKFPKKDTEKVVLLVRYHLFQSDPEKITDSAVRRVLRNVGQENIWDLIDVRLCDRIGSGVPKAEPYRLRKFLVMLEKAMREPVSLKELKINGSEIMELLGIEPGPRVGYILNALMNEILEEPEKNKKEYLESRTKELNGLADNELKKLSDEAKKKMENIEYKKEEETKKKYWVS